MLHSFNRLALSLFGKFRPTWHLVIAFLCVAHAQEARAQGEAAIHQQIDSVAFLSASSMLAEHVNDIGLWLDEETLESYLLVGCDNGTAFVKMLPGGQPMYMGKLPTTTVVSLWRDIKVLNDHAYVVSEAPAHGMQVFDLTALRDWHPLDGVQDWEPDAVIAAPGSAHNLAVLPEADMVIQLGSNSFGGGAVLFDASDPGAPFLAGGWSEQGYLHDAHALRYDGPDEEHHGKDLLFAAAGSRLSILDISDPSDVLLIGESDYPQSVYTHQVWVSESQDHAFLGDELDESQLGGGTKTIVFDLTDLDAPFVHDIHESELQATDHNQYGHGEWLFQSNYSAGLRMLSSAWPELPVLSESGYFDPLPDVEGAGFQGAWSHVILADQGLVAFTSINEGVWVVRPEMAWLQNIAISSCEAGTVPSPNNWSMTVHALDGWDFPLEVTVEGVAFLPESPSTWVMEESGSTLLYFQAYGLPGVQAKVHVTSAQSSWPIPILTSEALWPAHYADEDGDGYGNPNLPVWGCGDVPGTSALPLDCQDWNAQTYPLALELCDGWDNDCDGEADEGTAALPWYMDGDGDGFGDDAQPAVTSCVPLVNRVLVSGDCNDNEATMYPGAMALQNGTDNNCDGLISEGELNPCLGDFDLDGLRSTSDMLEILSAMGCQVGCTASTNGDDSVGIADLLSFLGVFGLPCN